MAILSGSSIDTERQRARERERESERERETRPMMQDCERPTCGTSFSLKANASLKRGNDWSFPFDHVSGTCDRRAMASMYDSSSRLLLHLLQTHTTCLAEDVSSVFSGDGTTVGADDDAGGENYTGGNKQCWSR